MKSNPGAIKVVSVAASFCATAALNLAKKVLKSGWEFWLVSHAGLNKEIPIKQKA